MTARARRWWQAVEAAAADADAADPFPPATSAAGPDAPGAARAVGSPGLREPWADRPFEAAALTADQRAVLAGLDDQPHGPRLDNVHAESVAEDQPGVLRLRPGTGPGNGTGNAPGDLDRGDPHTRTRWTEQEREA